MKSEYEIVDIDKRECKQILDPFHYLSKISKSFKTKYNFGLIHTPTSQLVGVCIFTGFPVPELLKGMYGLPRTEQEGFYELSRLCLHPDVQTIEHNLASWFVSRSIKRLRFSTNVRSVLSYADADFHSGIVYAASNFLYYGLSDPKCDYWIKQDDGSYRKHSRGKMKGLPGEWRPRSRKHRFVMTFDKSLSIRWQQQKWKQS
jgi:hypothetical protein